MAEQLRSYITKSDAVSELYITASSQNNASVEKQAQELFPQIREELAKKNARIFQERIFTIKDTADTILDIRSKAYGSLDDGVAPSVLIAKEGSCGPLSGIQIHAVICDNKPDIIEIGGKKSGRVIQNSNNTYLSLSCITAPECDQADKQARTMLKKGEAAIKQLGGNFLMVPRTWMWLGDILSWYDRFNKVRNDFFVECGILGKNSRQLMPASTGIGLAPADGSLCAMDLTAVIEPSDSIKYCQVIGKQQCAFNYGSAFSRASEAITPAGKTVFVSGTASIDSAGATTNIGNAQAQIITTIENVQAVLKDTSCTDKDVVQVIAYCKTPEVEEVFNKIKSRLDWPWITVICDICRHDLLFEIEATAIPAKK